MVWERAKHGDFFTKRERSSPDDFFKIPDRAIYCDVFMA